MNDKEHPSLELYLVQALKAAFLAGKEIRALYTTAADFNVELKSDSSPLTIADRRSHEVIEKILLSDVSGSPLPILSEEGKNIPCDERKQWDRFWLVDPLDGTKEFIKRNGEFTVNIALIQGNEPVLGVVYVPVSGVFYFGGKDIGACKLHVKEVGGKDDEEGPGSVSAEFFLGELENNSLKEILRVSAPLPQRKTDSDYVVIASRSHMNRETEEYITALKKQYQHVRMISAGSSLKLCLVAEGRADCYPRLGPTMEWDTAAAHAVANGAGRSVIIFDTDAELQYNKENLLNPWFVVK